MRCLYIVQRNEIAICEIYKYSLQRAFAVALII